MTVQTVDMTFETLHDLEGGKYAALLRNHLANLARDCIDRPMDDKERTLTIQFRMKPVLDPETRDCERVDMSLEMKSKVPVFRTKKFQLRPHNRGFLINRDFPDDLDQPALFPDGDDAA